MSFTLAPESNPCSLHKGHTPRIWRTVSHHVVPQAWTQQLGQPDSQRVTLCDTAHYGVHMLIDALRAGRSTPRVPAAYRDLADEAIGWWEENGKPPVHTTSLEAPNA